MSEHRRGVVLGVSAYVLWGIFPLYWPLFRPATALEILGHRVVWSLVFVGLLLARSRGWARVRALGARRFALLVCAAVLIGLNWAVYIWGVNSGHVVETSLGYFINPLLTVLLGVVALRERLRPLQRAALVIAAAAVAVLAADYGRPPWIALVLASSFALYGFVKKRAGVPALESLAVETAVLVAPAVAYLAWLEHHGTATFGHGAWRTTGLLLSTGIATSVPLLCFAGAANRVPLTTLGPLQYISPTLQFACGVLVLHEAMPPSRWIGFALVWAALLLMLGEGWLARSKRD